MLKLITSNEKKLEEFKRFGLKEILIEKGMDLKEVDSNEITVALYKSKDAGENTIIEDTSLEVEGEDVGINIRWLLKHLPTLAGKKAIWNVYLGVNDGNSIKVYKGEIKGILTNKPYTGDAFGFDPYFLPEGTEWTLHELEQKGLKDSYSARKKAIESLLKNDYVKKQKVEEMPDWSGGYQNT